MGAFYGFLFLRRHLIHDEAGININKNIDGEILEIKKKSVHVTVHARYYKSIPKAQLAIAKRKGIKKGDDYYIIISERKSREFGFQESRGSRDEWGRTSLGTEMRKRGRGPGRRTSGLGG